MPAHRLTVEQYLETERAAEFRSEYRNGEVFAMAEGGVRLNEQLRGRPCAVAGSDLRLYCKTAKVLTYPDLVVFCEPARFLDNDRNTLIDATVVVEVLSRSTQNYDRGGKSQPPKPSPASQSHPLRPKSRPKNHRKETSPGRPDAKTSHNSSARGSPAGPEVCLPAKLNPAMKPFGKENLDVLQNIEFGIVQVYRADPSLLDIDAKDAVEALIRHYRAEEDRRTPPPLALHERAQRVFSSVQGICEWRLGRAALQGKSETADTKIPLSDIVRSLKEIVKSIPRWSDRGGRQGYLKFVIQYLP